MTNPFYCFKNVFFVAEILTRNMKFRITPLNFASAFFLFAAAYCWIYGVKIAGAYLKGMGTAIGWIFLLFAVVVSFMDIMFRNFFPKTKNLWIVELSFITLAAIIFLLVK
jgi:hypothetical protein